MASGSHTVKKSESSLTADRGDLSPLAAAVALSSRETLPFNSGAPPVDIAVSARTKKIGLNGAFFLQSHCVAIDYQTVY